MLHCFSCLICSIQAADDRVGDKIPLVEQDPIRREIIILKSCGVQTYQQDKNELSKKTVGVQTVLSEQSSSTADTNNLTNLAKAHEIPASKNGNPLLEKKMAIDKLMSELRKSGSSSVSSSCESNAHTIALCETVTVADAAGGAPASADVALAADGEGIDEPCDC